MRKQRFVPAQIMRYYYCYLVNSPILLSEILNHANLVKSAKWLESTFAIKLELRSTISTSRNPLNWLRFRSRSWFRCKSSVFRRRSGCNASIGGVAKLPFGKYRRKSVPVIALLANASFGSDVNLWPSIFNIVRFPKIYIDIFIYLYMCCN